MECKVLHGQLARADIASSNKDNFFYNLCVGCRKRTCSEKTGDLSDRNPAGVDSVRIARFLCVRAADIDSANEQKPAADY
jgi:hypothetical protein